MQSLLCSERFIKTRGEADAGGITQLNTFKVLSSCENIHSINPDRLRIWRQKMCERNKPLKSLLLWKIKKLPQFDMKTSGVDSARH